MKTFCPNCEKETESTFICEVHCCNECDEDNGNYEKPLTTKLQSEIARLTERVQELEESDKYDTELTKKRIEVEATMWLGYVEKLQAKIRELEDANRWIPVSERLPKKNGWHEVLREDHTNKYYQDYKFFGLTKNNWLGTYSNFNRIVYWRENLPMPDVPRTEVKG